VTVSDRPHARRPAARLLSAAVALASAVILAAAPATAASRTADAGASASPAVMAEARRVISEALLRYESARTYRLDFAQENYWALADSTTVVNGTLFYERPGRMSLTYDDGSRVVVAGDSMRVYVAQTAQFFVVEVDSSDVAIDPPRLLRAYAPDPISPLAAGEPLSDGSRVVNLRPQASFGEPSLVEVTIDPASGTVTRIAALSSSGDRTTYSIRASRFGVDIPDNRFVLLRPADATLVKGSPF
jgi:outer membrane lipoprotein carrier protein